MWVGRCRGCGNANRGIGIAFGGGHVHLEAESVCGGRHPG
jgi:hypothetical protein